MYTFIYFTLLVFKLWQKQFSQKATILQEWHHPWAFCGTKPCMGMKVYRYVPRFYSDLGVEFPALLLYFDGWVSSQRKMPKLSVFWAIFPNTLILISVFGKIAQKTLNLINDYNNNYNCINRLWLEAKTVVPLHGFLCVMLATESMYFTVGKLCMIYKHKIEK